MDRLWYSIGLSLMCRPLYTLDELLNFHRNPTQWKRLVVPLRSRTSAKRLSLNGSSQKEELMNKREILVCHDFKGKLSKFENEFSLTTSYFL